MSEFINRNSRKAWNNAIYHIRRDNLLLALGLPDRIPVGQTGEWNNVEVVTGSWREKQTDSYGVIIDRPPHIPRTTVVLPKVFLVARGVANRIQVACPECGKIMRFCGLQQHVGSPTCKRIAARPLPGTVVTS